MSGSREAHEADTAIIIPHAGGWDILQACLQSLREAGAPCKVLLVDNASPDESVRLCREEFPEVEILAQEKNLGFAGGCNVGLETCLADQAFRYGVLLNNDTVQEAGWLAKLHELMERAPRVAAVQPKLLSIPFPGKLDYSGAAGGLLDIYGFPFARGRLLDEIEDAECHSTRSRIAWASGTACLFRLEALRETGLLEESFFMHMEEIDLDWRLRLMGWELACEPAARVYHHSGYSLGAEKPLKVFLNHRNSLRMLVRNAGIGTLLKRLGPRLFLDFAAFGSYLLGGRLNHFLAGLKAIASWLRFLPQDLKSRARIQRSRRISEEDIQQQHYPASIALRVRIGGVRRVDDLDWSMPSLEMENRSH